MESSQRGEASVKSILNCQEELYGRILKHKSNFKKSPKDRITVDHVDGRLDLLEQVWIEFRAGHSELLRSISSAKDIQDTNYVKNNMFDRGEEAYLDYKCELKAALATLTRSSQSNQVEHVHGKSSNVKLPKVNIPKFSGKYFEWSTFRDLFRSLVHNNIDLDNVQKLLYLKGYLTGEAEQLLSSIPITDANYTRCWTLLEERYNNKPHICHQVLKRLLNQNSLKSESAKGLKDIVDTTNDCLATLSNLGIDVNSWDILIIHILTSKLDSESRRQWEFNVTNNNPSNDLPTYEQFKEFLTKRFRAIEFLDTKSTSGNRSHVHNNNKVKTLHVTNASNVSCPFCQESHKLTQCKSFHKTTVDARRRFVLDNNVCFNCMGSNHSAKECRTNLKCRICKRNHHSLLHPKPSEANNDNHVATSSKDINEESTSANSSAPMVSCFATGKAQRQVLLATALIKALSKGGEGYEIRALLDQGSQASFITESTVQYLGLKKTSTTGQVTGLGGDKTVVSKAMVTIEIESRVDPNVKISVKAYVLKSITSLLPSRRIEAIQWQELSKLVLADPEYYTPNRIDLLLGAEVYCHILQDGVRRGPLGSPVAQETSFGWILSGVVSTPAENSSNVNVMHCCTNDNEMLKRFWELETEEQKPRESMFTDEEKRCEKHFAETTRREVSGRYVVRLPFKNGMPEVTGSRDIAEKRLKSLEHKLNKDETLKVKYQEVINDYLNLEYMEVVPEKEIDNPRAIYLPHHAVVRNDKETSKVRIVYDASCKGKNNLSLNDQLLVGPTLQPELRHIIMQWRSPPICISADIVKMYLQVRMEAEDTDSQRILWRDSKTSKIIHYRLTRVTFGTSSAPYLAVKALQQVAVDHGADYPFVAEKVLKSFYVDDLMTGVDNDQEGIKVFKEMTELLSKAGFELQKWNSNSDDLVKVINGKQEEKETIKDLKIKDELVKIMGLTWNRKDDTYRYVVNLPKLQQPVTKRKIISDISRLYDPLGWVGPSMIIAKVMIQKLWLAGLDWDEVVPDSILNEWLTYREEQLMLSEIRIPRWVGTKTNDILTELHGFCDASMVAYAAVVYIRVIDSENKVRVSLVSARTKVAPVKQVSIPRLELCGAVLLCKLMLEVAKVMNIEKKNLHAWTDSTVVLSWLNSHPSRWKVFVANRVSEIISNLDSHHWSHVPSQSNAADVASRGQSPSELVKNAMWLEGPDFLRKENIEYTKPKNITHSNLEEVKTKTYCAAIVDPIWERFSSLTRMIRITAYCRRFIHNLKQKGLDRRVGYLTTQELNEALNWCIKRCQAENFSEEIGMVKKKENLPKRSSIRTLNPFLDDDEILRVGGRLEHSHLSRNRKHPILIPKKSYLTNMLIVDAHKQTLHGGPQLMLNYLRNKYWILGAARLVKSFFRTCVTCVKNTGNTQTQLMGQLPSARSTPARPFKSSGVDFAGPIQIRTAKGRGHHSHKGYICLFVCMVTRAVHLEVVTDLTTEGFLQAFKRFVSRRGYCSEIWSDNATNFAGAASELKKLFKNEKGSMILEIAEALATNGCSWQFIPPRAPNFGGLWEAGVKSLKYHLKRVIGQSTLTFEEMATVLAQIEACLNSRPLSVITGNGEDDSTVLTPGHFLVGEALVTPPDKNYESSNVSSLRRWQLTQRMTQEFWRQWSKQYLDRFYKRYRWSAQTPQLKIGDVVVVREDNLPACRWLYGRVIATHPGQDNIVRVVTLKVKNGTIKRPVTKLCLLPITN